MCTPSKNLIIEQLTNTCRVIYNLKNTPLPTVNLHNQYSVTGITIPTLKTEN